MKGVGKERCIVDSRQMRTTEALDFEVAGVLHSIAFTASRTVCREAPTAKPKLRKDIRLTPFQPLRSIEPNKWHLRVNSANSFGSSLSSLCSLNSTSWTLGGISASAILREGHKNTHTGVCYVLLLDVHQVCRLESTCKLYSVSTSLWTHTQQARGGDRVLTAVHCRSRPQETHVSYWLGLS